MLPYGRTLMGSSGERHENVNGCATLLSVLRATSSPGSGAGTDRPVGLAIATPVAVDAPEKEGAVPGAGRESAA
jgi:hypothetical protein